MKFGRLIVISLKGKDKHGRSLWNCKCDCGNYSETISAYLLSGDTKSCGCLKKEVGKHTKKYNTYNLSGEYGIGYVKNNIKFIFDIEDYDKIKNYYWKINDSGYIISNIKGKNAIRLHRLIMNVDNNKYVVDHINHDTLDNRKINLRICKQNQNCKNLKIKKNNISGVPGVTWYSKYNKWRARINVNYKEIHLGYFDNFDEAVQARKQAEEIYYGQYSFDNSQKYAEQYKI